MADGLDIVLGDEQVKSVFVNVFGGITSCDAVANGIVTALRACSATTRPSHWSCAWTATTSSRAAGSSRRPTPAGHVVDTMDGAADRAAELAAAATREGGTD